MKKLNIILLYILFVIQTVPANNYFSVYSMLRNRINQVEQGGLLDFNSKVVQSFDMSLQNSDSLLLKNYTGLPLKALQFKIKIGGNGGKLIFKSLSRGSGIPASSFLFAYNIQRGELQQDGSSVDVVSAVILGWDDNVLMPDEIHHIVSIYYDVVQIENELHQTSLAVYEVVGATAVTFQDAKITTGDDEIIYLTKSPELVTEFELMQNFPNPFNSSTTIKYSIPKTTDVSIIVYDVLGREVKTLLTEKKEPGSYEINFNAAKLSSGVYIYQIKTDNFVSSKKMILLR